MAMICWSLSIRDAVSAASFCRSGSERFEADGCDPQIPTLVAESSDGGTERSISIDRKSHDTFGPLLPGDKLPLNIIL